MSRRPPYKKQGVPVFIESSADIAARVLQEELLCPEEEAHRTAMRVAEAIALEHGAEFLYIPKRWAEIERRDRAICMAWDGSSRSRDLLCAAHGICPRTTFPRVIAKGIDRGWIEDPQKPR